MKLSIITVNLNNRDGLQKTIDSVVSQTFKDFEWIVIDGGSTDGSKELIEQYADHFAYWVSEPDKGIYNAMNKGIKVAKGEYLLFLNSGDWLLDTTALERCFSHSFSSDIVYGDLLFCNGETQHRYNYPDDLTLHFLYNLSLGHCASFIKRELITQNPYNEELKIVSDWEFFLRQALNNSTFGHISEAIACFDTKGISSANNQLVLDERRKVIQAAIPLMLRKDYDLMNEMTDKLNDTKVKQVLCYSQNKTYKKILNACLSFLAFLDKHFVRKRD